MPLKGSELYAFEENLVRRGSGRMRFCGAIELIDDQVGTIWGRKAGQDGRMV
jgi:hypothetical protein